MLSVRVFAMIAVLALTFKGLQSAAAIVYDQYGVLGALAACALFYCASLVMERR